MPLLEVRGVSAGYDAVPVIEEVSLSAGRGQVVALLGPNGAGKTTTLRTIAGLLAPTRGSVVLDGHEISGWAPERIARAGLQFVPEGGGLLRSLTVAENLRLTGWRTGPRPCPLERAFDLFPVLADRRDQLAGTLSGGERQMLAIAQVLVTDARVVLIDEASLGLAPRLVAVLADAVGRLAAAGRAVILVEQNVGMALEIADRALVMEKGRVVAEGPVTELHGAIAALYLGEDPSP